MDERFPNSEAAWHAQRPATIETSAIAGRLGETDEEVACLSGGLANDNFRIGSDQVLRIYRRDVAALPREQALLSRPWRQLRVPRVLKAGPDFLLLEYVEHGPLLNTAAHGAAVGTALAEIHQTRFDRCGLFGDAIEVKQPYDDFAGEIENFIQAQIATVPDHAGMLKRAADWIAQHRAVLQPECDHPVLLHGDFKASNLHWANDGRLLVLDWEFTYAGPALMDLGQICRWGMPQPFRQGFQTGYVQNGGRLATNWEEQAHCFDLVNLVGLLAKADRHSRQADDCLRRIAETIA